ncbi:MAG: Zn-ribbon domain-containing OB-fold protein [Kofleriaceae bacterium]
MNTKITAASVRAIQYNADAATKTFYDGLKERRFRGTKCTACGHVPFPPREFCVKCHCQKIEWIDLPTKGTVHAFSYQQRSWRFSKPDVLGLVSLEGVNGLVLTKLAGKIDELSIGQTVQLDFVEVGPELVVHQFKPI